MVLRPACAPPPAAAPLSCAASSAPLDEDGCGAAVCAHSNRTRAVRDRFRTCGCSHWFPARDAFAPQVQRFAAHLNAHARSKLLDDARAIGIEPKRRPKPNATAGARTCLTPQCIANRLRGRWIMLVGDSTQRALYKGVLDSLAELFGFDCLVVQPHVAGLPVRDRDHHKDYDAVCLHPADAGAARLKGKVRHLVECFGPMHPECAPGGWAYTRAWNLSVAPWANASAVAAATVVSMRFLRGLDLNKLEHVTADWRQRYVYTEWRMRTRERPPNMFFESDSYDRHPVSRVHLAGRAAGPDVVVFNSGAWDLPSVNRSHYYWPFLVPENPCPAPPERLNVTVRLKEARLARVAPVPCVRRGITATDAQIFGDFELRLRAALARLRGSFGGRLVLRSCHSGTQDKRVASRPQLDGLRTMNRAIAAAARERCADVLDVFEVDQLAKLWPRTRIDFHIPASGSKLSAVALLLLLRLEARGCTT